MSAVEPEIVAGSLGDRAASAARWAVVQRWGSRGLNFVFFVLLARLLDPTAIGVVALASGFIAFLQLFAQLGIGDAVVQKRSLDELDRDSAFWLTLISSLVVSILVLLGASPVSRAVSEPALDGVLKGLAVTLPLAGLACIHEAIIQRELRFEKLAVRYLVSYLAGGLVGVTAAASGYGVWSLVAKSVVESVIGTVLVWRLSDWRPRLVFSTQRVKQLWAFGGSMTASRLVDFVNQWAGNWIVGLQLGMSQLGLYSVGQRSYLAGMDALQSTGAAVMLPALARVQHDAQRSARGFLRAVRLTAAIAFPVFAGLGVLSSELVPLVFGEQWREASTVLTIFCCGAILFSVSHYNSLAFYAMGRADWYLRWVAANTCIGVVALLVGARWGPVGVAVAYVGSRCIMLPAGWWLTRKLVPFTTTGYLRSVVPSALGSGALVATISLAGEFEASLPTPMSLAVKIVLGGGVYILVLGLTAPKLVRELRELLGTTLPRNQANTSG